MRAEHSPVTDWPRVADVLADARERPARDRAEFLDRVCRHPDGRADNALRSEVEALLTAAGTTALVSPVGALVGLPDVEDLPPGARVGPWRLTGVLGEGGQGVVYRAVRDDGLFERTVALKRLRAGPGQRRLADRLRAERQTLARLEHEGIARLYDGGVAEDGTPYLVMELVEGQPITAWAERHALHIADRVRLVVRVCEAVAYAHRRLVVHRDLKPSNVLVASDGDGTKREGAEREHVSPRVTRVKLLDFGVAKLLDADDPTQTAAPMLTRAYASPEQLTGGEITTATDVYALGVILYELLAGQRPHDLTGRTAAETERIVTGPPPSPPSAYRAVPRDLDTITAKALAVEPSRRYRSAQALADDLGRWLEGLPVHARPTTVGYRAARFVRRHQVGVAATVAVVLLISALTVLHTVRLSQERDLARMEAAKAEAVSAFLSEILTSADGRWASPSEAAGPDATVAEVLDAAVRRLDSEPLSDPLIEGVVRRDIGNAYVALSRFPDAERQLARSLALVEGAISPPHLDAVRGLQALGTVLYYQGRHAAADSIFRRSLGQARALGDVPGRDLYMATNNYGMTRWRQGDLRAAADLLAEAVAVGLATPEVPVRGEAVSMNNQAWLLALLGRDAEAERMARASLARLSPGDLEWAWAQTALARVHLEAGRWAAADSAFSDAEATFSRRGDVDAYIGQAMRVDRARLYLATGRFAAADSLARVAERALSAQFEPEAVEFVKIYTVRGATAARQGRPRDGEVLLREAIRRSRASGAPRSVPRVRAELWLGRVLLAQGRPDEAARYLGRAAAMGRAIGLPADGRLMQEVRRAHSGQTRTPTD